MRSVHSSRVGRVRSLVLAAGFLFSALGLARAQTPPIVPKPYPETVYVDASATGANNGQSWVDAFTTL